MKSIKKLEKNTVLKFFPSKLTPNLQEIQETDTWVNILIKIFGNLKKYIIFTNFKWKKPICWTIITAQKMRFSSRDFFSKCDQIRSYLGIWSHLLKKSLMENFILCAVYEE